MTTPRLARPSALLVAAALVAAALVTVPARGDNASLRPGARWPDNNGVHINCHGGGMLIHDRTFYWFGQHMIEGDAGNYAQVGVHVYSSKDLYDWKDEGIALRVSDDPKSDITKGCILERPKVIYNRKTGKFVMWFHLELKGKGYGAARSGVAVADQPTGPYRFIESFRPNAGVLADQCPGRTQEAVVGHGGGIRPQVHLGGGPVPNFPEDLIFRRDYAGGQMARDMTLFVDDDGTAFHIYASEDNGTLQVSQLTEDYLRPAGKYVRVFPGGFNEAPAVFKHDGKYYLITSGCTGWAPNTARLAVADSIWGPWKARAILVWAKMRTRLSMGRARMSCRCPASRGHSSLWPTGGDPRTRSTADLWLPIQFKDGRPFIEWMDEWDLGAFDRRAAETAPPGR